MENNYGLTALIPIKNEIIQLDDDSYQSYASRVRELLQKWDIQEKSPMSKVPNTYICRFYLLNDVFFEGDPAIEEHLKSKYIVFSSNFYGASNNFDENLKTYLEGMWDHLTIDTIRTLLKYCGLRSKSFFSV